MSLNRVLVEGNLDTGQCLQILQGDLTEEPVDAIVNAANQYLQHGGGVAGAIVRRGGAEIQRESNEWVRKYGVVQHDSPAYTRAGNLPCRYIIHAVGPVWGEGNEENKLAAAVTGSLHLAERLQLTSIAFPAISTGIFGFPKEAAAKVILSSIKDYCAQNPVSCLREIHITLFDQPTIDAFLKIWKSMREEKE